MLDSMVNRMLPYCNCQYTSEFIKVWYVKCSLADDKFDVILIAQLLPTNMYDASQVMNAMSQWVASSGAAVEVDGELMKIDKNCKVQIDHPFGRDCSEMTETTPTPCVEVPTATRQFNTNGDDDNISAGAAVGGVIQD